MTVLAVVLAVAGCGSTTSPSLSATAAASAVLPSSTAGGQPSLAGSAAQSLAVYGTEACRIVESDYTADPLRERFHCQEINSDTRLAGQWDTWILTHQTGGGVGTWTAEFVMTNSGGTWRGTGAGTVTGMPTSPTNLGLVEWVGQGGYVGLVYHEFIHGSNTGLVTAGWVEPAPGT